MTARPGAGTLAAFIAFSLFGGANAFLFFPLVAVALGALMLDEPVQPTFVIGGGIVLVGVYVGAVHRPRPRGPLVAIAAAEPE